MSKCDLDIRLEDPNRVYRGGETLRGELLVRVDKTCPCKNLTIAMEWRTEGMGDRTSGNTVVRELFKGEWESPGERRYPFDFQLPAGPASYSGEVLKVDWYLMAHADIPWSIDPKAEAKFLLAPGETGDYSCGPTYKPPEEVSRETAQFKKLGVVVSGLFALIGLAVVFSAVMGAYGEKAMWFVLLFGGIFFLLGGGAFLVLLLKNIAQKKVGVPEVRITPLRVRRGTSLSISIRLSPRGFVALNGVSAELEAHEAVTATVRASGSSDRSSGRGESEEFSSRKKVFTQKTTLDSGPRQIGPGETVDLEGTIEVPQNAAPTFAAESNELQWAVEVHIDLGGWADWKQEYPISVFP